MAKSLGVGWGEQLANRQGRVVYTESMSWLENLALPDPPWVNAKPVDWMANETIRLVVLDFGELFGELVKPFLWGLVGAISLANRQGRVA